MLFKKNKTKFRRVKNENEAVYDTYKQMKSLEIYQISESGLLKTKNTYQKMYCLINTQSQQDNFFLHGNEAVLSIWKEAAMQLIYGRNRNQFLLTYESECEDRNKAYETFINQEKIVDSLSPQDGMILKAFTANERLANIHDFFLSVDDNLQVKGNYLNEMDWLTDIQIDKKNCTLTRMKIGNKYCCVMYVRRFSIEKSDNEKIVQLLFSLPEMTYAKINWRFIPDKQIIDMLKSEYIGVDSLFVKMKRTYPDFVKIWEAVERGEIEDNGRYVGCNFSFVLETDTENNMDNLISNIQKQADSFHVEITAFTGNQVEALYSIISGVQQVGSTRTITFENFQGMVQAFSSANKKSEDGNELEEMKQIFFNA